MGFTEIFWKYMVKREAGIELFHRSLVSLGKIVETKERSSRSPRN